MKPTLLIIFSCFIISVKAQGQLSGNLDLSDFSGSHYTNFTWRASYRFETTKDALVVYLSNISINVAPGSDYVFSGERYSKSALGISSWPATPQRASGVQITLSVSVNGKNFTAYPRNDEPSGAHVAWLRETGAVNPSAVRASLVSITYNAAADDAVTQLIMAKKNQRNGTGINNTAPKITSQTQPGAVNPLNTRPSVSSTSHSSVSGSSTQTSRTASTGPSAPTVNRGASQTGGNYQSPVDPERYLLKAPGGQTTEEAFNKLGSMLSNLAEQNRADREYKAAREAAIAQQAEDRKIREANRKAALKFSREQATEGLKAGKIPLSSEKIAVKELYYFACSFYPQQFEEPSARLYVSNIFPVAQYTDGTWPFQNTILADLTKANGGRTPLLIGYYTDITEAENVLKAYMTAWRDANFVVESFTYKGKKLTGDGSGDFWGTGTNKAVEAKPAEKPKAQDDDFWGTGTITPAKNYIEAAPVKNDSKSQEVDFWGNPAKQSVDKTKQNQR